MSEGGGAAGRDGADPGADPRALARTRAHAWAALVRFAKALGTFGAASIPVGPPVTGTMADVEAAWIAELAPAFAGAIATFWREERLGGAPPGPLEVGPGSMRILAAFHDLVSLALRPDPVAARALGAAIPALPIATGLGDVLASHALLRHASRWHAGWPEPVRDAYALLMEKSPLTRIAQHELAIAREWSGTDVVFAIPELIPWLRCRLIPRAADAKSHPAAGAVLAALAEGRGTTARRGFVLEVYDAWFYHSREAVVVGDRDGAARERWVFPLFAELARLLRSHEREENRTGARLFAYFDPLLEIAATEPATLERYPYVTREAIETLAGLARWVARGPARGLAFVPAGGEEA